MPSPLVTFKTDFRYLSLEQRRSGREAYEDDYRRALQDHEKLVENAINRLAAMGDPVVQTLMDEYKKKSHKDLDGEGLSQYRVNIIRAK